MRPRCRTKTNCQVVGARLYGLPQDATESDQTLGGHTLGGQILVHGHFVCTPASSLTLYWSAHDCLTTIMAVRRVCANFKIFKMLLKNSTRSSTRNSARNSTRGLHVNTASWQSVSRLCFPFGHRQSERERERESSKTGVSRSRAETVK